jgi:outer membrane protein assembly factor BamB
LPPPTPPAVVGGRAYAEHDGALFVVDARSGAIVRRVPVKTFSDGTPPAVLDGGLYVGGNELSATDVAADRSGWTIREAGRSFQNVTVDAERVYFESASGDDSRLGAIVPAGDVVITSNQNIFAPRLVARDARTGAERWTLKQASRIAPVVAGDRLFIVDEGTSLVARELDVGTGRERWRDAAGDTSTLVVEGATIYLQYGDEIRALDLATKQRRWSGPCVGLLGVGGEVVVCAGEKVTALRADTGAPAWQVDLPERPWNPPVVAGGIVCIRTRAGRLLALDAGSGKLLWKVDLKGGGGVSKTGRQLLVFTTAGG